MRVLLVHNFHRSHKPSGEDVAYRRERDLLRASGVDVHVYERSNDEAAGFGPLRYLRVARELPFSRAVYDDLRRVLDGVRPDVVHVHNTFPLLTSAVFQACADHGVPVVATLHNYYLFCAGGTCVRDGAVCRLCLEEGNPLHAVRYGCYNGSRAATLPLVRMIRRNWLQGYWRDHIDGFVALTEFGRRTFVEAGLPAEHIHVKPHFVPDPAERGVGGPAGGHGDYLLFAGRLSAEKGVDTLLAAAAALEVPVKIAGSGPEHARVARAAAELPHVEVLGQVGETACYELMAGAFALVFPSVGIETFGLSAVEAMACGTPVIASDLGSLPEIVVDGENGFLFEAGDADALVAAVRRLQEPGMRARMGRAARATYEARFSASENVERLLAIYRAARVGC